MYCTYILKSKKSKGAIYIGYTDNLKRRVAQHNSPTNTGYTKRHAPWKIESYFVFSEKHEAKSFEEYLKSNSGKAFLRKRLISSAFKKDLIQFNNGRSSPQSVRS